MFLRIDIPQNPRLKVFMCVRMYICMCVGEEK